MPPQLGCLEHGHALKLARRDHYIAQAELAIKADLDRSYISALERGISQPSLETILKISKAMKIEASEFVEIVEQQANHK